MKWVLFFLIMLFLFNDKALTVMNYSDDAKEYIITLSPPFRSRRPRSRPGCR